MAVEFEPFRQLIVAISRQRIQPISRRNYAGSTLGCRSMGVAEKQSGAIRFKRTNGQRGHSFHRLIRFSLNGTARELETRQRSYAVAQLARRPNRKQLSHAATIS